MKLKLKSLAVALALSATALSAQANIDSGGGTNSELFFNAWDGTNGYTFDLPSLLTLNSIVGNDQTNSANFLPNLPTFAAGTVLFDGALTGFSSSFASIDAVQWNFGAFDNNGLKRFISTQDVSTTGSIAVSNLKVSQTSAAMELFHGAVNTKMVDLNADDSYALTVSTDGTAYAGTYGPSWNNNLVDSTNVMGATSVLGFYARSLQTAAGGNALPIYAQLGLNVRTYQGAQGEWRLELAAPAAAAAVPEPESYAMMLAGLAMLGGVARRRNKA